MEDVLELAEAVLSDMGCDPPVQIPDPDGKLRTLATAVVNIDRLKAEAKEAGTPDTAKEHLLRVLLALERFEKHVEDWGKVNLDARHMFDELTEAREDAVAFFGSPALGLLRCGAERPLL